MFYLINRFYTKAALFFNADIDSSYNHFLHNAVYYNDASLLSSLLARGAKVDVLDQDGYKSVYYAFSYGYTSLSNMLIDHGAKFNSSDLGFVDIITDVMAEDNVSSLEVLLKIGASVDDKAGGMRILSKAVKQCAENCVKLLIKKGVEVNAKDSDGKTPMHYVAFDENINILDMLLKAGVSVHQLDSSGKGVVYYALYEDNKVIAEKLVAAGAKIDMSKQHNLELLHHAAKSGYINTVTYMLESEIFGNVSKKIAVNMPDDQDNAAFMYAMQNKHFDIVKLFISHGADVDYQDSAGKTMVHHAAKHGHVDTIRHLYGYKADFSILDNSGKTALYYALNGGSVTNAHIATAAYLYSVGEKLDFTVYDNAILIHQAAKSGNIQLVTFLKSKGADLNYTDASGMKPVYYALKSGYPETAKQMFKLGSKFDVTDRDNIELVHHAVKQGNIDVIKLLSDKGVSLNKFDSEGHTPIYYAIKNIGQATYYTKSTYIKVLEILVANGANVNLKDYSAKIDPIFQAIDVDSEEAVEFLMKHGVNMSVKDFYSNKTPIFYAISNGKIGIAKNVILKNDSSLVNSIDSYTKDSVLIALIKAGYYTSAIDVIDLYHPDVNYKNPADKESILHIAVKNNASALVKALKDAGFDASVKNADNLTAYELAFNLTNEKAMDLLYEGPDNSMQMSQPTVNTQPVVPQVININIIQNDQQMQPQAGLSMPVDATPSAPPLYVNENIDYGQVNRVLTKAEFVNHIGYSEYRECLPGEYSAYLKQTLDSMHYANVMTAQEFVDYHQAQYGVYAPEEVYEQYLINVLHQAV